MRRKPSLYLETSVWSFFFADDAPERREVTHEFFREIEEGKYLIFISDLVITEVGRTREKNLKENLLALLREQDPQILPPGEGVALLAEKFVAEGVIPERFRNDALHIGYAVVHDMDILVSWNLQHIVKLKTRIMSRAIAEMEGYKAIQICTPEEVIGYVS